MKYSIYWSIDGCCFLLELSKSCMVRAYWFFEIERKPLIALLTDDRLMLSMLSRTYESALSLPVPLLLAEA